MNRKIKFRAWVTENQMIEHNSIDFNDFLHKTDLLGNINHSYCGDVFILMQFTGLHDKNGKEIYEGDILEYVRLDGSKIFYKVFYKKGGLVINIHQDDFKKDNPLFYEPIADMQTSGFIEQNCTIIGNIYENPELLSGGKK